MPTVPPPFKSDFVTSAGLVSQAYRGFYDQIFSVLGRQSGELFFSTEDIRSTAFDGAIRITAPGHVYLNDMKWPDELIVNTVFILNTANELIMENTTDRFSEFLTGDLKPTWKNTPEDGYIMCDDGSIGSPQSGATNRANDDTQPLYELLWNNTSTSVAGGRGASAELDWADNKALSLPPMTGRAVGVAGQGTGLTNRALGSVDGTEEETLTLAQYPEHRHYYNSWAGGSLGSTGDPVEAGTIYTEGDTITVTLQTGSAGGGQAHNNMQPSFFTNMMIKL